MSMAKGATFGRLSRELKRTCAPPDSSLVLRFRAAPGCQLRGPGRSAGAQALGASCSARGAGSPPRGPSAEQRFPNTEIHVGVCFSSFFRPFTPLHANTSVQSSTDEVTTREKGYTEQEPTFSNVRCKRQSSCHFAKTDSRFRPVDPILRGPALDAACAMMAALPRPAG